MRTWSAAAVDYVPFLRSTRVVHGIHGFQLSNSLQICHPVLMSRREPICLGSSLIDLTRRVSVGIIADYRITTALCFL